MPTELLGSYGEREIRELCDTFRLKNEMSMSAAIVILQIIEETPGDSKRMFTCLNIFVIKFLRSRAWVQPDELDMF